MREEYMIERQGKRYVLYAGLLDEAHNRGLRSVETDLIQAPGQENGQTAIVKAVVRTEEGKFSGIGDASPENVGRNIAPHTIRMAETRAKARALRDAINVAVTALEELGADAEDSRPERGIERGTEWGVEQKPARESVKEPVRQVGAVAQVEQESGGGKEDDRAHLPATRKQLNYLEALVADVVDDGLSKFEEMVGKKTGELTREEASEWIGRLSGRAA